MVQWSPDTNTDAWYHHSENQLYGFSLTHISGAGCPLYGDFAVLPTTETLTASPGAHLAPIAFDRRDEQAHPGYYAVTLSNGVRVELTVTERAGIARFIYPDGVPMRILVNAGSSANSIPGKDDKPHDHDAFGNHIEIKPDGSFSGWVSAGRFCSSDSHYKLYVAGRFNKTSQVGCRSGRMMRFFAAKSAQGKHTGAWLDFGEGAGNSSEGGHIVCERSRVHEQTWTRRFRGGTLKVFTQKARATWSDLLNRFAVDGGTADQRKIFYTGVYHSFLSPNLFSDEDGQYIGFDGKTHSVSETKQKAQYANFSDWDIYRNTVQLQALFDPQREIGHDAVAGERCGAERMVSALAGGKRRDLRDGRRFSGGAGVIVVGVRRAQLRCRDCTRSTWSRPARSQGRARTMARSAHSLLSI